MSAGGKNTYTVTPARYSKGMMLVRVEADGSGMMNRAMRLCCALNARWTNRERGYVMSPKKVERLAKLLAEGRDASLKFDSIYSARYVLDDVEPAKGA